MLIYFVSEDPPDPLVNSVVPAVAFVLATMSLVRLQRIWWKTVYVPERNRPHGN